MNVVLDGAGFRWPGTDRSLFTKVSLTIPHGQTTCLLGPNGAGKTTLLEMILGWRPSCEGPVSIDGRLLSGIPSRERGRLMALVPQDERLPFAYSVLDYLLLGRAPYLPPLATPGPTDRRLAMDSLERVGMAALAGRSVTELSGGELRLVLIARSLVQEPDILLLDEPTNHLDPANRESVIAILSRLHQSGITLIISSHEPDVVIRLAGNIVLLKNGRQPESGSPEKLLTPEHLSQLYGVPARIAEVDGRRVVLWGDS